EKRFWGERKRKKLPDWRTASARLRIERAQISAFQPLLPEYLSPQGQLSLDARLVPGGNFEGKLGIAGAGTRPFPSVGSIRDIQLSAKLSNFVVRLEKASGLVGGSLVSIKGEGALVVTNWRKEKAARLHV